MSDEELEYSDEKEEIDEEDEEIEKDEELKEEKEEEKDEELDEKEEVDVEEKEDADDMEMELEDEDGDEVIEIAQDMIRVPARHKRSRRMEIRMTKTNVKRDPREIITLSDKDEKKRMISLFKKYLKEKDAKKVYELIEVQANYEKVSKISIGHEIYVSCVHAHISDDLNRYNIQDIKDKLSKLGFNSDVFNDAKANLNRSIELLTMNLVQKDGIYKCKKCGKKKTTQYQLQTRSSDEPMTTFFTCYNCGNRWRG